jgi:hypothetical protein
MFIGFVDEMTRNQAELKKLQLVAKAGVNEPKRVFETMLIEEVINL